MIKNFFSKNKTKTKIIYILGILILCVFVYRIVEAKFNFKKDTGETLKNVEILNVGNYQDNNYVYATGKVESLEQLDIRSELSAKIKKINFNIGDNVNQGQIIMELDNSTLAAQLAQTQAVLDLRVAGSSAEDIKIYETAVELAKADLENTKNSLNQTINSYEMALKLAENNLNLGGDTLYNVLQSVDSVLSVGLTASDNIIGVDNDIANDSFEDYLGVLNTATVDKSEESYVKTKNLKQEFNLTMEKINKESSDEQISLVTNKAIEALDSLSSHLFDVQTMLDASTAVGNLSLTTLNGFKSSIISARSAVSEIKNTLTSAKQGENSSGNSLNTYNLAYEKAVKDLSDIKATAKSTIQIKETAYNQALAALEKIKANPREVDLAALKANVSQVQTLYNKSIIRAPFAGIISSMPYKNGDFVSAGNIITGVVNKEGMQVKVFINQKEKSLIAVGNEVLIEDKYKGLVSKIAPSIDSVSKKIEVIVAITDLENDLTIGQYANIKISVVNFSETQKYILPLAAVKIYENKKTVFFVDENNLIQEKEVEISNILGDTVEINKGLETNDKIVSAVKGLNIGQKVNIKTYEQTK
ncbi:MAG: efflux RND transporter periplasmic adaptor subunit [Patescibacteria group bacterium]